jgi:F0F1-type ATP synthase assembly protein I
VNRRDEDSRNPWVMISRYAEIGFIIPAAVLLGLILGKLLDYWLHTKWLFVAGLIFGAVAGFVEMIRKATSSMDDKP